MIGIPFVINGTSDASEHIIEVRRSERSNSGVATNWLVNHVCLMKDSSTNAGILYVLFHCIEAAHREEPLHWRTAMDGYIYSLLELNSWSLLNYQRAESSS